MQLLALRDEWKCVHRLFWLATRVAFDCSYRRSSVDFLERVKPTKFPATKYSSLREAVEAIAQPSEVAEVMAAISPVCRETDSPWWLNLRELYLSMPARRSVLLQLTRLAQLIDCMHDFLLICNCCAHLLTDLAPREWHPTREELVKALCHFEQGLTAFFAVYQARSTGMALHVTFSEVI